MPDILPKTAAEWTGTALMAVLILFLVMAMIFNWSDARKLDDEVNKIMAEYDEIEKGERETLVLAEGGSIDTTQTFLIYEFKAQAARERLYERVNRRYTTLSQIAGVIVTLFILFISIWAEQAVVRNPSVGQDDEEGGEADHREQKFLALRLVPFFAALALAIPTLNMILGFDARQQLHDFRAIQLEFLVVELEQEMVDTDAAWNRFKRLYRQSPASVADYPMIE